eukprot:11825978-Alexandrium_andersonii.AAC.1
MHCRLHLQLRRAAARAAAAAAVEQLLVADAHYSVAQLKPEALRRVRAGRQLRIVRAPEDRLRQASWQGRKDARTREA